MRVILFRHGLAEVRDASRWPEDSERPLTTRGEKRTRNAALGLRRIEPIIERILTSPFKRADHTARILGKVLEIEKIEAIEALVPGGSVRKILEAINAHPRVQSVVLVGHEPDLGALAGLLAFNSNEAAVPLKKAGGCGIQFEDAVRPGAGALKWLAPPRLLCRVNGKKVPL